MWYTFIYSSVYKKTNTTPKIIDLLLVMLSCQYVLGGWQLGMLFSVTTPLLSDITKTIFISWIININKEEKSLLTLSQLPAATKVFSQLIAISVISAWWPRKVANSRPSLVDHILTKLSSAPFWFNKRKSSTL